ncbi:MAG: VanZ family protein [Planctomycetia bacterium]|nr:VanZ family protein [Planctomycetia bacterium]
MRFLQKITGAETPTLAGIRIIFIAYWLFLSFVLLVYNPFAFVPIDEEFVEHGFGIELDAHVAVFILLGVLGMVSHYRRPGWLFVVFLLYAGITEYLQGFTGRCPDWNDVLNNSLGLMYGCGGWWICRKLPHGLRRK